MRSGQTRATAGACIGFLWWNAAPARIFMGDIKTWDDPALKKLNPNANLPKQAIAVVHRSDGSGT